MKEELLGKCGFYCGSCATYINHNCKGCMEAHEDGDCYSRDCVIKQGISFCGECANFPCDTIMTKPKSTVLDKDWLAWKKKEAFHSLNAKHLDNPAFVERSTKVSP